MMQALKIILNFILYLNWIILFLKLLQYKLLKTPLINL
jgi:hypothetical protein